MGHHHGDQNTGYRARRFPIHIVDTEQGEQPLNEENSNQETDGYG